MADRDRYYPAFWRNFPASSTEAQKRRIKDLKAEVERLKSHHNAYRERTEKRELQFEAEVERLRAKVAEQEEFIADAHFGCNTRRKELEAEVKWLREELTFKGSRELRDGGDDGQ